MCERNQRVTFNVRASFAIGFALLLAFQVAWPMKADAQPGIITTVAGTGTPGFSGDGGPATSAQIDTPVGLALDGSGNLFIADDCNHRIRKVDLATGIVTTVAGSGSGGCGDPGFAGDGGPATSAQLSAPAGVAVDGSGNLFIAEQCNHRIRRVDATGTITTVAGSGPTTCGAGAFGGDGGPATSARLFLPTGVTVDGSGNLLISDRENHRVRKVDLATGIITTVAGTATPGFSGDGGPATSARLDRPSTVALDGSGNLFIADMNNHRIRKVDLATGIITTVAGSGPAGEGLGGFSGDGGPATSARLRDPFSVTFDASGNLFISDLENNRVRKVDPSGIITTVAGSGSGGFSGDGGPATDAQLYRPRGVVFGPTGNFFIADSDNHRIRQVEGSGPPGPLRVSIDIKPGSFPNSINLRSKGPVPVAILSTVSFDATRVDPATVTLAGAPVQLTRKGALMAAIEDVNSDGRPDLVLHMTTGALQLSETDTEAVLEGQTYDATAVRGVDSVRIVRGKSR